MAKKKAIEVEVAVLLGMVGLRQTVRGAKMLAPLDLNQSKLAVLQYVADHETATITEISDQLAMNQPGVTKIVQQLLSDGLVKVGATDTDKRVKQLIITRKGLAKYSQTLDALLPMISEPYNDWSGKELEAFASSLDKLKKWLDENR